VDALLTSPLPSSWLTAGAEDIAFVIEFAAVVGVTTRSESGDVTCIASSGVSCEALYLRWRGMEQEVTDVRQ
jgi:hypothetical protein